MLQFKNVMENKRKPIKQILKSALQERVTADHAILKSVIRIVAICGQQSITLRGHHNDSEYYDEHNAKKFQALFVFRVDIGDHVFGRVFQNCQPKCHMSMKNHTK